MATQENIIKLEKENIELRKLLKDIIDANYQCNYVCTIINSNREKERLKRFTDKIKAAEEYLYPDED